MDNNEDYENIIKESKTLLSRLYSTKEDYKPTDTIDSFRGGLLTFIGSQLEPIRRTQDVIDLVDAEIVKKIILHEYDKNELLIVRRDLIQSMNTKTSVLLEPFKPTTGGGNTLITPPSSNDTNESAVLDKLTPEERTSMDKLTRILLASQKKIKETSNDVPV